MFIVSPSTLYNSNALETRNVPKRMIGRISIIPRRGASWALIARLIFEVQVLRFLLALLPFVIAMFVWPHLALPISQAPIPMLFVIAYVETRVFNMPQDKRNALVDDDGMARILDAFEFNARRVLTRVIAHQGLKDGEIHLVVEQSELGRVRPLTLVSIQLDGANPQVLDLSAGDIAIIQNGLFDEFLTEQALQSVTLREKQNLRSVMQEAADIPAHTRMAALVPQAGGTNTQGPVTL